MVFTRDSYEPYRVQKHMIPDLVFDSSVEDELIDLQESITSNTGLVMQRSTQFVLGELDINSDADWNNYVSELKRAGADRYEEIWKATLEISEVLILLIRFTKHFIEKFLYNNGLKV